jgi:hypothetical protein
MAMSIMEQQMSENIGEVEDMLRATTGLLKEADIENSVNSEKANAILAKYENKEGVFNENSWKALPEKGGEPIIIPAEGVKVSKTNEKYFQ